MCLSVAHTGAGRVSGHLLHFASTGLTFMLFKLKDGERKRRRLNERRLNIKKEHKEFGPEE